MRTVIAVKDNCYSLCPVERISVSVLIYLIAALALFMPQLGAWTSWWQIVFVCIFALVSVRTVALQSGRRSRSKVDESRPTISIIVPAHNEEAVIENLIRNLSILDYQNLEILIVDDRSTDRTPEILRNLASNYKYKWYSRAHGSKSGKATVLNEALLRTSGEFIAVFDADARINPNFLHKMIAYLSSPRVGGVQGRKLTINGHQNLLTRCQVFEFAMDAYVQSQRDTIFGAVELRGNGMLIRRSALQELGGFNEENVAEDLDLCTRMHAAGWDIRYAPDAKVFEEATPGVAALFRQRVRWTEGSLIRYLEHARAVLASHKAPLLVKVDLIQFCFECVLPCWMLLENTLLAVRWFTHTLPVQPVSVAGALAVVLSGYFLWISFKGIHRFVGGSILESAVNTLILYLYLSLLFLPISLKVIFSILVRKQRNLAWVKTQHFGSVQ